MSTNEQEAPPAPSAQERVLAAVGMTVAKATDTGPIAGSGMTLRVWALVVGVGAVVASHPEEKRRVAGIVGLMALALTLASRVRGGR